MKAQHRKVDLLHEKIWKILQNEPAQKNEIIKSLIEIQSTVFVSLSAGRNDQTISNQQQQQQKSQQLLEQNQQIFLYYCQQNIFKKYAKLIFFYAKKQANLKDTRFWIYLTMFVQK